ncbi:hypothetical protein F7725_022423 [Dissostichus mawsoni]|uniref:DDE Tnp4 domain-containing protein n=1 Tax=Dissostichus mawsoni TaxID=36200 RepID=A0A7J5Z244_DISMA|nr:hypothetical protein F7725_022423 [Dissostichus mawsoni]
MYGSDYGLTARTQAQMNHQPGSFFFSFVECLLCTLRTRTTLFLMMTISSASNRSRPSSIEPDFTMKRVAEAVFPSWNARSISVPVLDRFFNDQDTRPDFRLSRESLKVLLDILGQDRRHGWGATIETLVFLFWLASGASCRVVSRVFGMPRSTVHRIVHRVTEEVVAIRHQIITACAVLHNICIGAGDIMAPEEDIVEDVAEDEGENVLEAVSGAPWRDQLSAEVSALEEVPGDHDYPSIASALRTLALMDNPMYCGEKHPQQLWRPPQMKPHPPSEDTRVLIVAARSSSTTWDSLLSLNERKKPVKVLPALLGSPLLCLPLLLHVLSDEAVMALPQPDPRPPPPLGPPLLNLAVACRLE